MTLLKWRRKVEHRGYLTPIRKRRRSLRKRLSHYRQLFCSRQWAEFVFLAPNVTSVSQPLYQGTLRKVKLIVMKIPILRIIQNIPVYDSPRALVMQGVNYCYPLLVCMPLGQKHSNHWRRRKLPIAGWKLVSWAQHLCKCFVKVIGLSWLLS